VGKATNSSGPSHSSNVPEVSRSTDDTQVY
jgi:hypothetical protein